MSSPVDIKQAIAASVIDLFETMLSLTIVQTESADLPEISGQRITGSLSFAGDIIGSINIQLEQSFARKMTAAMLGMDLADIQGMEEVKDVVREACNIIGGNLKTAIENAGIPCAISTPSITDGDDFQLETIGADRYERMSFQCDTHALIVELAIKAAEKTDSVTRANLKAIDVSKFSRLDIISSTGDKVIELFDIMLAMPVQLSDAEAPFAPGTFRMMGGLNFAGQVLGNIQIQVSVAFARIIAAAMLGIKVEEVGNDDELKDVVGEMANIIGGNLKAAFNDSGLNCRISPPNITMGRSFNIETANMDRYERFAFRYQTHDILVEVCVKIDETAKPKPEAKAPPPDDTRAIPAATVAETPAQASRQADAGPPTGTRSEAPGEILTRDNLSLILDIPLTLTVELGRATLKIEDLLRLEPGATLTMANLEGEPLDILANEKLVARGEVVVEKEKYAIRITEIVSRLERIDSLK